MRRSVRAVFLCLQATVLTACPDKSESTLTQETGNPSSSGTTLPTSSGVTTGASGSTSFEPTATTQSSTSTSASTSTGDDNSSAPATDTDPVCVTKMLHEQPPGPCDPFAQDCFSPCEKCNPYSDDGSGSWNSDKCVPVVPDPDQLGEPCTAEGGGFTGFDTCDHGLMCWDVDDNDNGTCVALCTGSAQNGVCADPETACAVHNEGTLPLCLDRCDPLTSDCQSGDLCVVFSPQAGFLCLVDSSGDGGQIHTPCQFANSCDPGLVCANPDAAEECVDQDPGCCEPYCDLTAPNPDSQCPGVGQQCTPLFDPDMNPAPPGHEDVGYCSVPQP